MNTSSFLSTVSPHGKVIKIRELSWRNNSKHHIGNEISVSFITCHPINDFFLATDQMASDNQYSVFDCIQSNNLKERDWEKKIHFCENQWDFF